MFAPRVNSGTLNPTRGSVSIVEGGKVQPFRLPTSNRINDFTLSPFAGTESDGRHRGGPPFESQPPPDRRCANVSIGAVIMDTAARFRSAVSARVKQRQRRGERPSARLPPELSLRTRVYNAVRLPALAADAFGSPIPCFQGTHSGLLEDVVRAATAVATAFTEAFFMSAPVILDDDRPSPRPSRSRWIYVFAALLIAICFVSGTASWWFLTMRRSISTAGTPRLPPLASAIIGYRGIRKPVSGPVHGRHRAGLRGTTMTDIRQDH